MSTVESFIFLPKIFVYVLLNHHRPFLPVSSSFCLPQCTINLLQLSSRAIEENVRIERDHQRCLIIQVDSALVVVKRANIAPVRCESVAEQSMVGVESGFE